jgi:hypothetical protein
MSKEEFGNCLDIDYNAQVVATMTVSEICEAVANDKSKLAEESESNCTSKEEEILQPPPSNAQMRETLKFFVVVCNIEQQTFITSMSLHSETTNCKQTTGKNT